MESINYYEKGSQRTDLSQPSSYFYYSMNNTKRLPEETSHLLNKFGRWLIRV